ncbi:hypothetical protein [Ralstonia phage phiRSL1]|uniref:Uncharacterized protein n=1 Tax=Ralstonia phage phiRSL1 TaxID=1980924 RepID=B2ZXN4_9CAUD|nr:hypothetical protein RSL1_ORF015 [Ralstonia phage phiRSL1]BAG41460.1 hypothetical protein [Ralstonia phage phiRSL1]
MLRHRNVKGPLTRSVVQRSEVPVDVRTVFVQQDGLQFYVSVGRLYSASFLDFEAYTVTYHGTETLVFTIAPHQDHWTVLLPHGVVNRHGGAVQRFMSLRIQQPTAQDAFVSLTEYVRRTRILF